MKYRCRGFRSLIVNQLPTVRLGRRIGRLAAGIVKRLKDALAFALDLEHPSE